MLCGNLSCVSCVEGGIGKWPKVTAKDSGKYSEMGTDPVGGSGSGARFRFVDCTLDVSGPCALHTTRLRFQAALIRDPSMSTPITLLAPCDWAYFRIANVSLKVGVRMKFFIYLSRRSPSLRYNQYQEL